MEIKLSLIVFSEKNKELLALLIIALTVIFFCLPILENPFDISINSDWNQVHSYIYFARSSILQYFQFPLRCPYFGGGYPLIANPQDLSLSPIFIIMLIFGEILGTKIACVFTYFLCAFGMYYLTRSILKFSRFGALFSSLSLTLCSWLPNQLMGGNFTKIYYYFTPLLVAFLIKSEKQKRFIIYSSFIMALMLLQAGLSFAAICLFLIIFCFFYPGEKNKIPNLGIIKSLLLALFLTMLLSAVKLIPLIWLLTINSRDVAYNFIQNYSLNIKTLLASLTNKNYHLHSTIYMGYATLFLALFSFIFEFKKVRGLFFTLAIIIAILCGPNSIINLSALIWRMPIFHSMLKLDKYYSFFVAFLLSLAAGYAFKILRENLYKKLFIFLALLLITFNTFDIFINNITFHKNIFTLESLPEKKEINFSQAQIVNNNTDRDADSYLQYALLKKNVGVINWYGNIYLKESTIPKYLITIKSNKEPFPIKIDINPEYKGELFFVKNDLNTAKIDKFTPNYLEIKAFISTPDILVINQNFDRSWRTKTGELTSWNGLLAIRIHQPGEFKLKLSYVPLGIYIGLGISMFSLILSLIILKFI
jgi:hypothetical protein